MTDCGQEKPAKERQEREGRVVTLWGAGVNLALIAVKIVAGVLGHSQALIADGIHSVSDLVTDVVALVGLSLGRSPADADHHFGHGRLETVASGLVGVCLIGVAAYILAEALQDIGQQGGQLPTWLAVAAAALSFVVKEILYRCTVRVGKRTGSPVVTANAWHHRSDALSSLAVLVGVTAAVIEPGWYVLDAWAALVVSLFIAWAGGRILLKALKEFVDTAPDGRVQQEILRLAWSVPGVLQVHDLKARASGGRYQMELHVVVDGDLSVREGHVIAKEVESLLRREVARVDQVIIHVDPAGEGGIE